MEALSGQLLLAQQTNLTMMAAAMAGTLLGAAIAYWSRGPRMVSAGAIIGAFALPLSVLALAALVQSRMLD
ncbi:hypothetical protein [Bosea rubneri]|uniref:Major facilitator superfamily (MFS) profile domain-containing protein n=1 Tax=Bosea rubneri TaxID=3075434 RepID=A0ABU3S933_9HYPH|nr:hypothetical protein [Bosea sp. ZW T0_25]MDU0341231.1 hypothetical protein [Bosea sp. ZW T0_25]